MKVKAFLSRQQQQDLLEYVVANGESYPRYLKWADDNDIRPEYRFTEAYFPRWIQRHRRIVQAKRTEHQVLVRTKSTFDRAARLLALEEAMMRLESAAIAADEANDFRTLVQIEEQKRKHMESIAKERGEFNQKPQDGADTEMSKALRSMFMNTRLIEAKDVTPG